jgi:hypothetical protein
MKYQSHKERKVVKDEDEEGERKLSAWLKKASEKNFALPGRKVIRAQTAKVFPWL